MNSPLQALLDTAGTLQPHLYINGPYASVDGLPMPRKLHAALLAVAAEAQRADVVRHLEDLAKPRCLEPLDDDFSRFCPAIVGRQGKPCPSHAPANAAAYGRCSNDLRPYGGSGDNPQRGAEGRMCPEPPVPGQELCTWHQQLCRVVLGGSKARAVLGEGKGRVCARYRCTIPAHRV